MNWTTPVVTTSNTNFVKMLLCVWVWLLRPLYFNCTAPVLVHRYCIYYACFMFTDRAEVVFEVEPAFLQPLQGSCFYNKMKKITQHWTPLHQPHHIYPDLMFFIPKHLQKGWTWSLMTCELWSLQTTQFHVCLKLRNLLKSVTMSDYRQ